MAQYRAIAEKIMGVMQANQGLWAEIQGRSGIYTRPNIVIPEVDRLIAMHVPGFTDRLNVQRELSGLIREVLGL